MKDKRATVQTGDRIRCMLLILPILFGLMIVLLILSPRPVLACSPLPGYPRYTVGDQARAAPVVLEGTVMAVSQPDQNNQIATVEVHHYFKGDGLIRVTISGLGSHALCLASVEVGQRLIFFATSNSSTELLAHYLEPHDAIAPATPEAREEIMAALTAHYIYIPLVIK